MLLRTITFGRLLTIFAISLSFLSLFLPWVDVRIEANEELIHISQNGFVQQGYLLFVLLIYPIYCIVKKKSLHKISGILCSAALLVITYSIIETQIILTTSPAVNTNGIGIYLFLLSNIILFVSVLFKNDATPTINKPV